MLQRRVLALLAFPLASWASVFDASLLSWTLKNENGSIAVPGHVPSQNHLDLYRAGILTEPTLGINDYTQRWVSNDTWTYTADILPFLSSQARERKSKTLLVFYGIDTVANITLKGHPVAWVNNQFRQFVFDVSSVIDASAINGDNNLTLTFENAHAYGLNVSARPDIEATKPPPPTDVAFVYPHSRQYVRKQQSDWGWDWGPAFLPAGIYKPAQFVTLDADESFTTSNDNQVVATVNSHETPIFIEETSLDIYKLGQNQSVKPDQKADWVVNASLAIRSARVYRDVSITLTIPELDKSSSKLSVKPVQAVTNDSTWLSVQWHIPDNVPQRWYPHDLATGPKLYDIKIFIHLDGHVVESTQRTGFRTVELIQDPYTEEELKQGITPGDKFSFKINGVEFYSRGTNVIPMDTFYSRTDQNKVRWLLESAVKTGQNMIRIWGGGIYQPSDANTAGGLYSFHGLCDELGLMVWTESIFADLLYQTNDFLVENFAYETRSNVRRLNRHPSTIHWTGGNEVEVILFLFSLDPRVGREKILPFVEPYRELFQDILFNWVSSESRSIPYSPCSFTRGVLSMNPYKVRVFEDFEGLTYNKLYGTYENYDYDPTQSFNYSGYPSSRYMVEFGINSMPSIYSWEEALESPDDFNFTSEVVVSRQHRPPPGNLTWPNPRALVEGQGLMLQAVSLWTPEINLTDSRTLFAQQCYSSQVYQASYMLSEISWYRLGAGKPEQSRGVVVWQLNDVWQAPSWSAIEYSGRWKILMYSLDQAFKPVIINPFWHPSNQTLEIYASSDAGVNAKGKAQWTWYDWNGKAIQTTTKDFEVANFQNTQLFGGSGYANVLPAGVDPADVWLKLNITATHGGKTTTHEREFTLTSLNASRIVDPQLTLTHTKNLQFSLSAKGGVAAWTWLEHPADTVGYFIDANSGALSNGFYLIPGQDRQLKFIADSTTSKTSYIDADKFVVRSLWNNSH